MRWPLVGKEDPLEIERGWVKSGVFWSLRWERGWQGGSADVGEYGVVAFEWEDQRGWRNERRIPRPAGEMWLGRAIYWRAVMRC